ncbi:hypothetical protein MP638_004984 [Amoeboaphelidium occidentale]|nr:hypothetical protein MP638_004984 [Amoeboaphelidium occidentale]
MSNNHFMTIISMLVTLLLIHCFNLLVSTLQHEKSFVLDSTASSVFAIALYNGSLLVTSSHDVVQKDIHTGSLERKFIGHTGQIFSLLATNDSTMKTSGWDDMNIVWDLTTDSIKKRIWLGASKTFPNSIVLLGDNLFVCGKDGKVRVVNKISSKVAQTINVNGEANVIIVSGDYFYVVKGGMTLNLVKYSISKRSLQLSYTGHQSTVLTLFLLDDKLFSGSTDTTIICWNEYTSRLIRVYEGHIDSVRVVSIHENYLYSAGQEFVIFKWNIESGNIEKRFPVAHKSSISSFAFDDGILYSGSLDTSVIKWDLNTSSRIITYSGRNKRLRSVVLWKNLVVASGDTSMFKIHDKSQDLVLPVEIMSGRLGDTGCILVHADVLFSGGTDKTIRSISLIDFSGLRVFYGHSNTVSALGLDERFLYSGSLDSTVKRWNITTGFIDKEYLKHTDQLLTIQIGPIHLYSGSTDKTVRVWDKESSAAIDVSDNLSFVQQIYIFNDIIIVASLSRDAVSLTTGEVLAKQEEPLICLSIVANMFRVYSGHEDGIIRGRDILDLNVLELFQGHTDIVMSLILDEADILFSAGFDGSVKRWNMATRKVSF